MNLRERYAYKSFNYQPECSVPPLELSILLYDKQGKLYKVLSQQCLGGIYGNLAGDMGELSDRIIEITPQLKEHLRGKAQEESKSGFSFFGLFKKK